MCSMSTRSKKEIVVNAERECQEHVTPDIGGKFVAIFGNVTKIITLRWEECSWKCLLQWCLWALVHLVSDNMAIHCSHLGHGPTLLSWCPRLFLSETHTLRSGCETTTKPWRYDCGRWHTLKSEPLTMAYTDQWYSLKSGCEATTVCSPRHGSIAQLWNAVASPILVTVSNTCLAPHTCLASTPALTCLNLPHPLFWECGPLHFVALPKHVSFWRVHMQPFTLPWIDDHQEEVLCSVDTVLFSLQTWLNSLGISENTAQCDQWC